MKFRLFTTLLIIGAVILFSLSLTSAAQPQQNYNKQYLDPLYREGVDRNQLVTYTLDVDTPDGISTVDNAMITFQVWHNPSVRYSLWVNGQTCNTETFYVSTSYANAGEGTIFFDCSNIITSEGTYTIEFQPDDDIGTITGWVDLTYINDPKGEVEVHGTEYLVGEPAKIWLQLLNSSGDYIIDGVCYVDVYGPDNDEYLERALMTNMLHDGIYYYDLTAPFQAGVYPAIARCYYDATTTTEVFSSYAIYEGDYRSGDIEDTWVDNNDDLEIKTDDVIYPFNRIDVNFTSSDYFSTCGGIDEELMSGISILWKGKWETGTANHDVNIYIWNYTSNSWLQLSNEIIGGLGGTIQTITNTIETNNITTALGISSTNPLKIRVFDTAIDEGDKALKSHYMYAGCDQLSNPEWQEVKGSSEMHITSLNDEGLIAYWRTDVEYGQIENNSWTGNFTYYFNIQSLTALNRTDEVYIDLPTPFPCHHYLATYVEGVEVTATELSNSKVPNTAGCRVHFDYELQPGTNFDAYVVFENWFKEEEQNWMTETIFEHGVISQLCMAYQTVLGFDNYTIPSTTPINYSYDDTWNICQQYLDQFYHFNYSYFEEFQTPTGNFTDSEMAYLDNQWDHLKNVKNDLDSMAETVMNSIQTANDYSVIAPTSFWATASSSYLIYNKVFNISEGLTNVSVDTSEISDAVWNYSGTVNSNLISQFVSDIWSYTGSIASAILDAFTADVWSFENRTASTESLWVGGTEYSTSETTGKVVVRVIQDDKTPITGATCTLYISYPNNTLYLTQGMTEATGGTFAGVYYADFNQSGETGVHPYAVDCSGGGKNYFFMDTYHVFPSLNETALIQDVWNYSDRQLTNFTFTVDTGLNNLTAEDVWLNSIRNLTFYPNTTDETNYTLIEELIDNRDDLTNYTLIQELIIAFGNNNTDLTNYTLIADLITALGNNNTDLTNYTEIQNLVTLYGNEDTANYTLIQSLVTLYGNEDVTDYPRIQTETWNATTRTLTDYNQTPASDLTNYTLINQGVWSYFNRTLSDFDTVKSFPAHQYLGGTEYFTGDDGKISVRLVQSQGGEASVETGASCNITILYPNDTLMVSSSMTEYGNGVYTYDFTTPTTLGVYTYYSDCAIDTRNYYGMNTFHIWDLDEDAISQDVWTYTTRELTTTADVTDYSRIQEETWNATTRELTYYPTTNVSLSNDSIEALGGAVWEYEGNISQNILTQIGTKVQCYLENLLEVDDEWAVDILAC